MRLGAYDYETVSRTPCNRLCQSCRQPIEISFQNQVLAEEIQLRSVSRPNFTHPPTRYRSCVCLLETLACDPQG